MINQLKLKLKKWEHEFLQINNAPPTKDDIKKLPEIKRMYKEYALLKKKEISKAGTPCKKTSSSHQQQRPTPGRTVKVELGPTPQIYGKVISLFEMNLSPVKTQQIPVVSPCKTISQVSSPCEVSAPFLPSIQEEGNHDSVKRQLTFLPDHLTPSSSPFKKDIPEISTSIPTSQCSHNFTSSSAPVGTNQYYGPNSPLKLRETVGIVLSQTPKKRDTSSSISRTTPSGKSTFSIHLSPSPIIGIKRTFKSLSQLAKEHEQILDEFKMTKRNSSKGVNQDDEEEEEIISHKVKDVFQDDDETEEELEQEQKRLPQRKKRRRILRPALLEKDNNVQPRNIHNEITKLKQNALNQFMGVYEEADGVEEGEPTETDRKATEANASKAAPKKTRKSKYNTVSNNFRRLKLPSRSRNRNPRWRRR